MIQNLKYLLLIRLFAIGGQVLAFFFMHFIFAIRLPIVPISIIIAALGLFTIYSWQHIHRSPVLSQKTFLVQLLADLIALSLLIYFTGGSINPFISLFIIPIIFAAASLKTTYTWIIAGIALACYTLLMFFHVPLTQLHQHDDHLGLHIWGMWYGFILSAILVAFFVSRIARTMREQDRKLAAIREEKLHAEQILALGTLAAGTAHELGTPLATMAVLTKELEHEHADNTGLSASLELIRRQIDRCKSILARMAIDAGELQAESGYKTTLADYLTGVIDDWRITRPDVEVNIRLGEDQSGPPIIADHTLTHALVNVLNNAADAAANRVDIGAVWDENTLAIEIHDDGHGIDHDILNNLGKTIVTSKTGSNGMGLGLFLAQTTFNRYGGSIQLSNRTEGGVTAVITLPLASIIAH
jgi:two-component system sensor histidine kinase RegB